MVFVTTGGGLGQWNNQASARMVERMGQRERYMRENRGKDAANAEQHFSDFACEIGMSAADAFTGRFREHFIRDAEAAGLHLAEEGRAYAAQEQTAWRQKILADDTAQTLADIAAAPGDGNYIQERINNLKLRHLALFPKEDAQGVIDGLDHEAAGAIIDGFLAQGRLEDARGALERHRDFLGERAAGYERKIREVEARARQQQAEVRVGVAERLQHAEEAWKEGRDAPDAPSRAEIESMCGSDAANVWKRMEDLRGYGEHVLALRAMAPEQQNAFLQQQAEDSEADQDGRSCAYSILAEAVAKDRVMRKEDSAEYLVLAEPVVAEARTAMLRQMTPQTVARYASALQAAGEIRGMDETGFLPKEDAAKLAASIEDDPDPVAALTRLKNVMGAHWPALNKQLAQNGNLSATMGIVAAGMNARAGRLLLEAVRDKDFHHKTETVLALRGERKREFEETIYNVMSIFNSTFLSGGDSNMPYALNRSVNALALQYMMRGYEADEAVGKAANEVVLSRYSLAGPRGRAFRVPAGFDAGTVEIGAVAEIQNIVAEPSNLLPPPSGGMERQDIARRYAKWVGREGYWVTDSEESGLILFIAGRAVRGADGDVIRRTWDELVHTGAEERARLDLWQLEVPGAGL